MSRNLPSILRLIDNLKKKTDVIPRDILIGLHNAFQNELKFYSSNEFSALKHILERKLADLFKSQSVYDNRAALYVTLCIICCDGVLLNDLKSRLHNFLTFLLQQNMELKISELIAITVSHFASAYEPLCSQNVDILLGDIVLRLNKEKMDTRKITALFTIREIAFQQPANFFQFLANSLEAVLRCIKDAKLNVREASSSALRMILWVLNGRESQLDENISTHLNKYYIVILNSVLPEFRLSNVKAVRDTPKTSYKDETIHGSLLVLFELYRSSVLTSTKEVPMLELESRELEPDVDVESYKELHAVRLRHISGALLSQAVTPLTMLQRHLPEYLLSYSCRNMMKPLFKQSCSIVVHLFRSTRTSFILQSALEFLPWLTCFNPEEFASSTDFNELLDFVFACGKKEKLVAKALISSALLCVLLEEKMRPHVHRILSIVEYELSLKETGGIKMYALTKSLNLIKLCCRFKSTLVSKKTNSGSILSAIYYAVALLAKCFKENLSSEFRSLLEYLIRPGLSSSLCECLEVVIANVPSFRHHIHNILHSYIYSVIIKQPASTGLVQSNTSSTSLTKYPFSTSFFGSVYSSQVSTDVDNSNLLLALKALEKFDFDGCSISANLSMLCDRLLRNDDKRVRIQAIKAICKILTPLTKEVKYCCAHGPVNENFDEISASLRNLVVLSVSDCDPDVRYVALSSLEENPKFNYFIAHADNLNILFFAVNDEVSEIREVAISLIGQLSNINPAYVLPPLRKLLLELVNELEIEGLSFSKEQAIRSIGNLVSSAPRLLCPYIHPMMQVLITLINEDFNSPILIPSVRAIGEYAQIATGETLTWVNSIFPILIKMLQPSNSSERKEVALWTMKRVIQSSGYVGEPYRVYPELLTVLLDLPRSDPSNFVHRETLRVLGVLGALDPFKFKLYTGQISNEMLGTTGVASKSMNKCMEKANAFQPTSGEDMYAYVVVNELLVILRDPLLKFIHLKAMDAIIEIFSSVSSKCSLYASQVIEEILTVIKSSHALETGVYLRKFSHILSSVKQDAKPFMGEIIDIICECWFKNSDTTIAVLLLIERLACIFSTDFKMFIIRFLPNLLDTLKTSIAYENRTNVILSVLHLFSKLGALVEQHMHLIIPAIVQVFENSKYSIDVRRLFTFLLRKISEQLKTIVLVHKELFFKKYQLINELCQSWNKAAILTLKTLVEKINLNEFASGIIIPLLYISSTVPELQASIIECIISFGKSLRKNILIYKHQLEKTFDKDPSVEQLLLDAANEDSILWCPSVSVNSTIVTTSEAADGEAVTPVKTVLREENLAILRKCWQKAIGLCKDDLMDWFRTFTVSFLRESPSPVLRACYNNVFESFPQIAAKLFNVSFMSCWSELAEADRDKLLSCMTFVLNQFDNADITHDLLELAEFFDHSTLGPLPIDLELLSKKALELKAYAKALHYIEERFKQEANTEIIESLISYCINAFVSNVVVTVAAEFTDLSDCIFISLLHSVLTDHTNKQIYKKLWNISNVNNNLQQNEAAYGALNYARVQNMSIKELWYEKLDQWDKALRNYEFRQANEPDDENILLGRMRCLEALGEWSQLQDLCIEKLNLPFSENVKQEIAEMGALAAWGSGSWTAFRNLVQALPRDTVNKKIYESVLFLKDGAIPEAHAILDAAENLLQSEFILVVSEDQSRSYDMVLSAQALMEMEEVINYRVMQDRRDIIRSLWYKRLTECCQPVFEDWYKFLLIHTLVLSPVEDQKLWLKLANLCTKSNKPNQAKYIFTKLLGQQHRSPFDVPIDRPFVTYSYLKHRWRSKEITKKRKEYILSQMQRLIHSSIMPKIASLNGDDKRTTEQRRALTKLLSSCFHKCGIWSKEVMELNDEMINSTLSYFQAALDNNVNCYKAWNAFGSFSYDVVLHYKQQLKINHSENTKQKMFMHTVPAIQAFFRSIALSKENSLQNTLRLLTLWFEFGSNTDVYDAVNDGLRSVPIETWLQVIPQLIARIDSKRKIVAKLVQQLLIDIARQHPQALIYPLVVTSKSACPSRQAAAEHVLKCMREHSDSLVQQALLVSEELIRISILWHEQWYESLDEASRLYFGDRNIKGFLDILAPLHVMIRKGCETLKEKAFVDAYGEDLNRAFQYCQDYLQNLNSRDLVSAWDLYYKVFQRITIQMEEVTSLDLKYVSPKLLRCYNLELAVPGTYHPPTNAVISISRFESLIDVIKSKQKPRKVAIIGSNGERFIFLLKGHEDLRQDQRVMQLFGLVNNVLATHSETQRRDLAICRYSVIPLAPNNGLIGWVPHCDTLHALIKDYRESKKIVLNIEHRIMQNESADYDKLPLINRVEIFEMALESTVGNDLAQIFWQKSPNAESWFIRRLNYTRSLAVMSIVGYILGLGDRHPSNLMIDRLNGKVVHVDFGDCFEVAMTREKFPETIPFRLTRMLINALEVTGINGTFRLTCESVMTVLRSHKNSLMAVLEAFVYDPLINWRLITPPDQEIQNDPESSNVDDGTEGPELLNNKALAIVNRVKDKLTGMDFGNSSLDASTQVEKLIKQAISNENLCLCYIGWCPFW